VYASYAVTQMCFAAAPLLEWTRRLRDAGITLPVRPGVAAAVGTARLLRIGTRIGVGRSLRLLGGEDPGMRRLLSPGRWEPGPLLEELSTATAEEPGLALLGPHVYTFNDLRAARRVTARR
jgi:methylenetetrahydrofolate reductase (NADPH)